MATDEDMQSAYDDGIEIGKKEAWDEAEKVCREHFIQRIHVLLDQFINKIKKNDMYRPLKIRNLRKLEEYFLDNL